jgi:hypothetical protein|tara:strand:- start:1705 stop:1914 length:210 start_codon:yes stop_codon:yes gene_type:complete
MSWMLRDRSQKRTRNHTNFMGLGIRNVCNEGQHIPPKSLNGRTAEKIVIKKAPSDIMGLVIRIKQSIEI